MAGTRRLLTAADRAEISTGLKAGWSPTRIAQGIGRATSVVTREVARNSTKTRGYRMVTADVAAQKRRSRPQARKVATDPVLKARVLADLKRSWILLVVAAATTVSGCSTPLSGQTSHSEKFADPVIVSAMGTVDEVVLASASGRGDSKDANGITTDGSYIAYIVCTGGVEIHVLSDATASATPVPCTGKTSRVRFLTTAKADALSIKAGADQSWGLTIADTVV